MKQLLVVLILTLFLGAGCAIQTADVNINANAEGSTNTFGSDDQNILRDQQLTGTIEDRNGEKRFVSSAYPFSFAIPSSERGWNVAIAENMEGKSAIVTIERPDPTTDLEYGHFVSPNQARIDISAIEKSVEPEYYAELLSDLENTTPLVYEAGADMFGLTHEVEKEESTSVSGHSGKLTITHNPVANDPVLGDDHITVLVKMDDETILRISSRYGLGEDHDLLKNDILSTIDSLEFQDAE